MSIFNYTGAAKERVAYLEALGVSKFEPRGFYIVAEPVLKLRKLEDIPDIKNITHTDPAVLDLVMEGYTAYLPMIEFRRFVCGAAAGATFVDPSSKENVRTMLMLLTEALLDEFTQRGENPVYPALASWLREPVEESFSAVIEHMEPSVWHQALAYVNGFFWVLTHTLPPNKKGKAALVKAQAFMKRVTDYGILPE